MVTTFSPAFLAELSARAAASPRRRQHHNIHAEYTDEVQRLFNAIGVDSYIRPHRHSLDPKRELLIGVRGRFALILFDDDGEIERSIPFGCAADLAAGAEVGPRQWHTVVALEENSILLEVKEGPFEPAAAKEHAPWSPDEDDTEAVPYLRSLQERADMPAFSLGSAEQVRAC